MSSTHNYKQIFDKQQLQALSNVPYVMRAQKYPHVSCF